MGGSGKKGRKGEGKGRGGEGRGGKGKQRARHDALTTDSLRRLYGSSVANGGTNMVAGGPDRGVAHSLRRPSQALPCIYRHSNIKQANLIPNLNPDPNPNLNPNTRLLFY